MGIQGGERRPLAWRDVLIAAAVLVPVGAFMLWNLSLLFSWVLSH